MKTAISALPKIVTIIALEDHGPCDPEPSAVCPHCGAYGRYIYRFMCEDGTIRGAMRGCVQLFPRHRLAHIVQGVLEKKSEYDKKHWRLATWDDQIIEANSALGAGSINVFEWECRVDRALNQRTAYLNRRYRRRVN